MKKTAVVYWSGTGNTEAMADAVLTGMKDAGADAVLYTAAEFSPSKLSELDAVAFGCPAMGAEMLEESEFEPMFNDCKSASAARRSRCSAHTAGVRATGCAAGRTTAPLPE